MKTTIQRVAVVVVVMGLFFSVSTPAMANGPSDGCPGTDVKPKTSSSCDKDNKGCDKDKKQAAACDTDNKGCDKDKKQAAACDKDKKGCDKDRESASATTSPRIEVSYKDFSGTGSEADSVAAAPKSSVTSVTKSHPLEHFDVQVDGFL